MKSFKNIWNKKPLRVIILIALIIRLFAVVFSQGYGVYYDHFMVIETAQAWVDGTNYQNWLPGNESDINTNPIGHSFSYVGLHYFLFKTFESIGIMNAHSKILIIRFLHALFSLLVVSFAYRITHLVTNKNMARYVGLLAATFWIIPFASVHNLATFFAVPFLMWSIWLLLRPQFRAKPRKWSFIAGLILGTAVSIWFFILIFVLGVFIVFTIQKNWKAIIFTTIGVLVTLVCTQGVVDFLIWGKPFTELLTFFSNIQPPFSDTKHTIFTMYIVILIFLLIPPISIFWLIGWIYSARKNLLLFLPPFLLFLFFSLSVQQHERYIMAIFPFILIAGVIGWDKILQQSVFWNNHPGLYRSIVILFWIINFTLLFPVTTMYSKKSQVESMYYIQRYKQNVNQILVEDSNRKFVKSMPLFYTEKWIKTYKLAHYKEHPNNLPPIKQSHWEYKISSPRYFTTDSAQIPDFVLFVGQERLDERIQRLQPYLPDLQYKKTIKPGIIDQLLYKVNPHYNVNQSIYIYQVQKN